MSWWVVLADVSKWVGVYGEWNTAGGNEKVRRSGGGSGSMNRDIRVH